MSSSNSTRVKKSSKDDKKKAHASSSSSTNLNDSNSKEKERGADMEFKQYAGISPDIISHYAEQAMIETRLTEDVCNVLSEDINYKLRYIINEALLKARLCGRDVISSNDIEETFTSLSIDKVHGASDSPIWMPFTYNNQSFLYLDDSIVDLVQITEEENNTYVQYGDFEIVSNWYPEPNPTSPALKNYFVSACQSLTGSDEELRDMVLKDISENPQVGQIAQWFYHFAYFLLINNITFDSLTVVALDLVETLENSPLNSVSVSTKQLRLLVRLLLQRLLLSYNAPDVLRKMCFTLSILCLRCSLKEMTLAKVKQKLETIPSDQILSLLSIIYYLGVDAIKEIFLPHVTFFFDKIPLSPDQPNVIHTVLAIYNVICKAEILSTYVHNWFDVLIENELVIYWPPSCCEITDVEKLNPNFAVMKSKLIKTRRKISGTQNVIIGKTTLLLPELNRGKNRKLRKCCDHSLLSYIL
ncbi:unnamed protein product [Phyllotreta striolata]|uniref:Transcription initiation factor TFIID subunit 6 n=1 Tax=Phyllotreta striolata TaxID=444603 RepID=A0A9N9XKY0_PHYSR|nr:unnamed protein product [Phyllotreta striolata]